MLYRPWLSFYSFDKSFIQTPLSILSVTVSVQVFSRFNYSYRILYQLIEYVHSPRSFFSHAWKLTVWSNDIRQLPGLNEWYLRTERFVLNLLLGYIRKGSIFEQWWITTVCLPAFLDHPPLRSLTCKNILPDLEQIFGDLASDLSINFLQDSSIDRTPSARPSILPRKFSSLATLIQEELQKA